MAQYAFNNAKKVANLPILRASFSCFRLTVDLIPMSSSIPMNSNPLESYPMVILEFSSPTFKKLSSLLAGE